MNLQESKDKVDIIAKRGDLIYKKLLVLTAISGGSWLYGSGHDGVDSYFSLVAFVLSSVGVVVNLFRLGDVTVKIKDIEDEY